MGIFDNIREGVEDTIDKGKDAVDNVKDEVEDRTGVDIDRDGNVGNNDSGGSSSPDRDSSTVSSDSSGGSSGGSSSSGGGDVSFDTGGGSSGGSSSGGSSSGGGGSDRDVVERDNEEVKVEDIEIPDRSNEDFEQKGSERVEAVNSVTVEDQETSVETSSGNQVSRADLKQKEAQARENKINLQNQQDFLESQGRTQQAQELEQKIDTAETNQRSLQQDIQNFGELAEAQDRQQNNTRDPLENNNVVTGRDGIFTQLDADTNNRQINSLNRATEGTRENAEFLSNTRPAQFLGQGAAGVESFFEETFDTLTPDREFESETEEDLFDTRTGRTATTSELTGNNNQVFTDVLDVEEFDVDEAQTVTQDRVDEFASDFARPSAALTQADDFAEFGASSVARLGTQPTSRTADLLTEEDLGSQKVDEFNIAEGAVAFGASTAKSAQEDPARFLTQATVDTATGTAALRGTKAGASAARKAPDAVETAAVRADPRTGFGREPLPGEPRPNSLLNVEIGEGNTVSDFISGDLTKQRRTSEGKEFVMTDDPDAPGVKRRGQEVKENVFNTREGEDGVTIDPETQDALIQEDLSRTEFIENRFDIDFSKGQAQLTQRPRQTTDTDRLTGLDSDSSTSTDVTTPQDRLQDVARGFDEFADNAESSLRRGNQRVFNEVDDINTQLVGTTQTQDSFSDQTPQTENIQGFEQIQEQPQAFEQFTDQQQVTDSGNPFRGETEDEEIEFFRDENTRPEPNRNNEENVFNVEPQNNNDNEKENVEELFRGSDKQFQFDSSLGAELTGLTAEDRPDAFNTQDPLSLRPVVDGSSSKSRSNLNELI